jgi:hypothetical protein
MQTVTGSFANLAALPQVQYTVGFANPCRLHSSHPNLGGTNKTDSIRIDSSVTGIDSTAGQNNSVDAGPIRPTKPWYVWYDQNNDGEQATEKPVVRCNSEIIC